MADTPLPYQSLFPKKLLIFSKSNNDLIITTSGPFVKGIITKLALY